MMSLLDTLRGSVSDYISRQLDAKFQSAQPSNVVHMECNQYLLTAISRALDEESANTTFVVGNFESTATTDSWVNIVIPFLATIKIIVNPEIEGYIITKIEK